jgi:GT2 family glycosyltransferase
VETDPQLVPSVVSVMVVHEPGDWFDETLASLAAQDYPNLRTLFLATAHDDTELDELTLRIRDSIPSAFVRALPGNIGYGPAINEVLRLVEGDNGFFLACHDDVVLEPDAVRLMVAELFRSNAGIVGPKLVEWDQPRNLQHVGLGLDRFGEVDPIIDPGEVDQEQHDAVRDVFVLPSACLLVRADLFRALGGFDPTISFHGEDIDLCWRAHLTGARVIVAPDARVRHRERLVERRPDLAHRTLQSRHRMRTVATLTGGSRLLVRSIQLVLLTVVELVVGLFSGRFGEALSSLRALVGLIPRTMTIGKRRRTIRGQRVVPEREVLGLQDHGSSRLTSYLRGKETTTFVGADSTVRRWREASFGPLLAWFVVLLAIVIGSRSFIRTGVPPVGEFLPFPSSPSELWDDYRASFDGRSFGSTVAVPTGWAILSVSSVLALFRMELFLTMSVVGLYVLGAIGAWRLATVFPVNRARIAGMVIYVGTPLVPGVLSRGDWSALAWFAALPWLVHLLSGAAGLAAADPAAAEFDLTDGIADVGIRHRARALSFLVLVLAVTAAFVPVVVVLWAAVGVMLAVGTLLAGGSWRVALWLAGCTVVSVIVALLLNLPWALEWSRDDLVGVRPTGSSGRGLAEVASLAPNGDRFAVIAIALYLPVIAAVAITRAWRLTWSVRAAVLVLGFGAVMVFSERGVIDTAVPPTPLLAVPVALGLALGGAAIAGGFGSDVLGRGFGWRQPFGLLANAAIVVGLIPGVLAIGDGAWNTPRTPMPQLLATQLRADPAVGDFRVLYVGDPRVMPVPAREFRDGVAYAVADSGAFDFTDRFAVPATAGDAAVERALDLIASGSTLRAGRILAPLGIRYVVVPKTDGVNSTVDDPIPLPEGLIAALQNQLDIGSVPGQPSLEVFVNQAFIPVGAQLSGATAEASRSAGEETLVRADLSGAVPSMVGADDVPEAVNEVAPGVVHLAVPFDDRITLEVDGQSVAPRSGFGVTTAFDVESAGTGQLRYESSTSRGWWIAAQMILWLVVLIVAAGARSPFVRRRSTDLHDETLIDLSDAPALAGVVAGEALGVPSWSDDEAEQGDESDSHGGAGVELDDDPDPDTDVLTPPVVGASAEPRPSRAMELPDPPPVAPRAPGAGLPDPRDDGPIADLDEVDLAALVASVDDDEASDGSDER